MDREELMRENEKLLRKRMAEKAKQPQPIKQVCLEKVEQSEEEKYILAINDGGFSGNEKEIVEAPHTLWRQFDDERHPDLTTCCKLIKEWYDDRLPTGGGIILAGGFGSGKTHLAKAIHQVYGGSLNGAVYYNEREFVNRIQDSYGGYGDKHALVSKIHRAKLLIYDDLGAYYTKSLEWLQGLYLDLFDDCKPQAVFVTTNLDDEASQIADWVGPRVYDRLMGKIGRREFGKRFLVDMFDVPSYR